MLMINPNERLGAPFTTCGMDKLKVHPFFKGLDFSDPKNLRLTDYHRSLIRGEVSPLSSLLQDGTVVTAAPRRGTLGFNS
jgi:hypothetical protein